MIFDNNITYQTCRILIATFGTLGMLVATSKFKENKMKNWLIFCGYAVYVIAFSFLCIRFFGFLFFLRSAIFTISIPGVVITFLIAETSLSRHIFCSLSNLLLSLYTLITITQLSIMIGGNSTINLLLILAAYIITIILEYLFLRKIFLSLGDIDSRIWKVLAPIPCSFFLFDMAILLFPAHYTQNTSYFVLFFFSGIILFVVYYAIFKYLQLQYLAQIEEHNNALLKLQIENIQKQTKDFERKADAITKARQNIRQMMSNIAALAKEGKSVEILNYIEQASAQNLHVKTGSYCSDPILNATLTSYFSLAENYGITVEKRLSFPEKLPVDSAELSICFGNALENAINACKRLQQNERKIIIRCIHRPQFMFEIENVCHDEISFGRNGLPLSQKSDHGIGTRSIMAFCERNNAYYSFSVQNGWFKLVITL
ncbi:MAG: GHKL domain-containing protein [Erysipelotrichaceae bacterium]